VKFVVSDDGESFKLSAIEEKHNHETSRQLYEQLPKVRALDDEQKKLVIGMMAVGANKKLVVDHVHETFGNATTLKDIDNIVGTADLRGANTFHFYPSSALAYFHRNV
jgi:hypothetical protein